MLEIQERVSVLLCQRGRPAGNRRSDRLAGPDQRPAVSPAAATRTGGNQEMSIDVRELATNAIQHGSTDPYRRPVPVPGSVSARRPDGTAPDDNGAPSDDDLLRMHVEGDPDAFGALFRRHRDQLWAVAIRTLGDPEEAADALQDAMVSAFRRAATFRGDSAVMTWLHRIVVNACLDRMRRRAARPASGGHDDDRWTRWQAAAGCPTRPERPIPPWTCGQRSGGWCPSSRQRWCWWTCSATRSLTPPRCSGCRRERSRAAPPAAEPGCCPGWPTSGPAGTAATGRPG